MKVLLASSGSGSRGGGENFLYYLGAELSDGGHAVSLWLPSHRRMDELAERCSEFASIYRTDYRNTYDYRLRSVSTCFNWPASHRVAREWDEISPDVIHINKQNLEDGLDLLRAAKRCSAPSVCTIHLTQTARYLQAKAAWIRDLVSRWQLRKYRGTFVAVQEKRAIMLDEFLANGSSTETVFNGVSSIDVVAMRSVREMKRKELGLEENEFLILGVGRLVEQKRPMLFLRIAEKLNTLVPEARFIWVGDGNLIGEWQKEVARTKLGRVVSLAGWQDDVLPFLLAGDLLVHVAQFEGLPFVVIESMAAELACAVTREIANDVPVLNEKCILIIDDLNALADQISDRSGLRNIARNGRELVENTLSRKNMAKGYERLYLEAIKTKARSLEPSSWSSNG